MRRLAASASFGIEYFMVCAGAASAATLGAGTGCATGAVTEIGTISVGSSTTGASAAGICITGCTGASTAGCEKGCAIVGAAAVPSLVVISCANLATPAAKSAFSRQLSGSLQPFVARVLTMTCSNSSLFVSAETFLSKTPLIMPAIISASSVLSTSNILA